nr:MAG TPA: hypothetical protein [Bacteriophage sp.]
MIELLVAMCSRAIVRGPKKRRTKIKKLLKQLKK